MKGPGGLNGRVRRLERLAGTRRVCPAPHGRTVILKPGEAPDPDRPLPCGCPGSAATVTIYLPERRKREPADLE